MDEEKATKWWNCQKKTFSTFHRAVRLHSRIQWKIDANYANVYVKVHSTVLLASTFFSGTKCVFLALHQYITTAMNMIGGNLTEVSIVIFFFLFLCSGQSMKLNHWQIGDDIKIQALQIAKEWEIFRNIRLWCSGIIVETTKLLLNYF